MSADNGFYVAKIADNDYRVAEIFAVDNIDWYMEHNEPEKVYDYWKNEKSFATKNEALLQGHELEDSQRARDGFGSEYGVSYIGDFSILCKPYL